MAEIDRPRIELLRALRGTIIEGPARVDFLTMNSTLTLTPLGENLWKFEWDKTGGVFRPNLVFSIHHREGLGIATIGQGPTPAHIEIFMRTKFPHDIKSI